MVEQSRNSVPGLAVESKPFESQYTELTCGEFGNIVTIRSHCAAISAGVFAAWAPAFFNASTEAELKTVFTTKDRCDENGLDIKYDQVHVAFFYQIDRHRAAHVAQSHKSDFVCSMANRTSSNTTRQHV